MNNSIKTINQFYLKDKSPYAMSLVRLIQIYKKLDKKKYNTNFIKAFIFFDLFNKIETILLNPKNAPQKFDYQIKKSIQLINEFIINNEQYLCKTSKISNKHDKASITIQEFTAKHYGKLFSDFSNYHYYKEPVKLLKERLIKNKIKFDNIKRLKALDLGCGGGRYTGALAKLGFNKILGIDLSKKNIQTIKKFNNQDKISFQQRSLFKTKLKKNSYDFVFCNGVLHHTPSISDGIKEIKRILKNDGSCFLYLSGIGGIKWSLIETFRKIFKDIDINFLYDYGQLFGLKKNRIFYTLDHVLVPINTLLHPKEIDKILLKLKISKFQRLDRGTNKDEIENIFKFKKNFNKKLIYHVYGTGENRYLFFK